MLLTSVKICGTSATIFNDKQRLFWKKTSGFRSSRPEVFCKKGVLKNFAKFTGKHLCQSLFFDKVAGAACSFIKKETLAQMFSCEFCEISKNTFFYRTPSVATSEASYFYLSFLPYLHQTRFYGFADFFFVVVVVFKIS